MDNACENVLLERAKEGDVRAFEEVLHPHLGTLLAYSRTICGNHHMAEDVVQETALIAFKNIKNLFPEADFLGWLRAIARNQALAARRKSSRIHPLVECAREEAYSDPSPAPDSPERIALVECLKQLSDRASQIIRAHYYEGSSVEAMSIAYKLNPNTLKTILFRTRQALEACVQRHLRSDGATQLERAR